MSMGYYDGPDHPEVEKMIDHIFNLVLDHHKFIGSVAGTAKQAQVLKNKGATMILNSVQGLLKAAGKQFLSVRHV
jgi:4-hydroxy-2-oxoheptanedioate aldolase